jgi:hypothetical protein
MRPDVSGTWHNEQGSEMVIEATAEGRLAGRFHSAVGFGTDEEFALAGFATGNVVAFTVDFGKYGSLTSWVGHLVDGELRTLWQMTLEMPHPKDPSGLWHSIWSGANTFVRGQAPREGRDRRHGPPVPLWTE